MTATRTGASNVYCTRPQQPGLGHADRGTSMTSKKVSQLLIDLGVTRSHSRPKVSKRARALRPASQRGWTRRSDSERETAATDAVVGAPVGGQACPVVGLGWGAAVWRSVESLADRGERARRLG